MVARLRSERDDLESIVFPADIEERRNLEAVSEILAGQEKLFAARRDSLNGQTAIVEERIGQLKEEIQGLRSQVRSKTQQIELIEDELKGLRVLFDKGYTTRPRILSLEREAANLDGERGEHRAGIARSQRLIGASFTRVARVMPLSSAAE